MTNNQETKNDSGNLSLKDREYVQSILERGFFLYDHEEYLDMISERVQDICGRVDNTERSDKDLADAFRELHSTLCALVAFNRQYISTEFNHFESYRGSILCKRTNGKPPLEIIPPLSSKEIEKMRQEDEEAEK